MQLGDPAPHVVRLRRAQRHAGAGRGALQPLEGVAVAGERALGEAPLDAQVLEMARQVAVERGRAGAARHHQVTGRSRYSPALAISPMRTRNSVPMSAL